MKDIKLMELLVNRQETAVSEVQKVYGHYLHSIAFRVLNNIEDSEECVNDTLLKAWETIPPQNPKCLRAYLAAITRNISLDYYRKQHREKRNTDMLTVLDECQECGADNPEKFVEIGEVSRHISEFLQKGSGERHLFFISRYYYGYTTKEIASMFRVTEGKVKMTLSRMRKELKKYLEKEGVYP